ncbi:hypothetical protein SELMODRAFT_422841 [Selaginella moellendorffii]|uniref:Uncharacterized protein n=1 Tax=Selaginella moellendorffii TaxID=88036 RepID=D8SJQ4_SELML|nr:hypothetical protein SELMODRAFT_422841 [Selaginella moellendorffii]
MSSDEDYEDYEGRPGKRQRLLQQITNLSDKELEALVNQLQGKDKSDELFAKTPCEIKEQEFWQRFGLLSFCRTMPLYDRFCVIEMRDETLRCISDLVTSDVLYSTTFQGEDPSEAPILDRMTRNLGRFTRPGPEKAAIYSKKEPDRKQGFAVKYANNEELLVDPDPELSSEDEEEDVAQCATLASSSVVLLHVFKSVQTVRGQQLKFVKEWKTKAGIKDLFQPAMYAIDELRETAALSKDYWRPVYIMAEDKSRWYYGVLEIDGFVQVRHQRIVSKSLKCFPEKEAPVNPKKFTPSATQEEVLFQFAMWKKKMALEDMKVPDGLHPVGRFFFYTLQQGYEMPSTSASRPLGTEAKRYFDGMLKVLVGRRETNWSPTDALQAWRSREFLEEKAGRAAGVPAQLWPLLHPQRTSNTVTS